LNCSYGLITSFCVDSINQQWMLLTASSATTKNMLLWDLRQATTLSFQLFFSLSLLSKLPSFNMFVSGSAAWKLPVGRIPLTESFPSALGMFFN
jgi:hypothetical protein